MGEKRGMKALEAWCRRVTDGYKGVRIDNMTTSWRDGLAFCAIIHHFRPDLIDFDSLDKNDVYRNNELAFRTAEHDLGIPALLDAEDMVEYEVPDRLSILTYLSQLYQALQSDSSPARISKRPTSVTERGVSESPPTKVCARVGRREPCAKCGLPVFIAERLIVGGHTLYHRTCFRCARCQHQLSLANCYETEGGQFCCETCPDELLDSVLASQNNSANLDMIGHAGPQDEYSADFELALESSVSEAQSPKESALGKARLNFISAQLVETDSVCSVSDSESNNCPVPTDQECDKSISLPQTDEAGHTRDSEVHQISDGQLKPQEESTKDEAPQSSIVKMRLKLFEKSNEAASNQRLNKRHQNDVSARGVDGTASNLRSDKKDQSGNISAHVDVCVEKSNDIQRSSDGHQNDNVSAHTNVCVDTASDISSNKKHQNDNIPAHVDVCVEKSNDIQRSSDGHQNDNVSAHTNVCVDTASDISSNKKRQNDDISALMDASVEKSDDIASDQKPSRKSGDDNVCFEKSKMKIEQDESLGEEENRKEHEAKNLKVKTEAVGSSNEVSYPEELNPFGEAEEVEAVETKVLEGVNPFSSSDEETSKQPVPAARKKTVPSARKVVEAPKVSLNPFWSDGEEPSSEDDKPPVPLPRTILSVTPEPSPLPRKSRLNESTGKFGSLSSLSSLNSSTGGSVSHRKKKPAPAPPRSQDLFPERASSPSLSSGPSPKATPRHRKNRPAPPPPSEPSDVMFSEAKLLVLDPAQWEEEKSKKDVTNRTRQSAGGGPNKSMYGQWKRKKGPAPPRPVPQRRQIKAIPMKEVRRELEDIEVQQQELERQGVALEKTIRSKFDQASSPDDESSLSPDVEDLVLQLFELVNEKNELFRRQAELMYLRRQQRLEEEHADLEYQIRCLMERPEHTKTDSDKAREEELIQCLVEVVERRNEIIECLEMDRIREAEEDRSIHSRLGMFSKGKMSVKEEILVSKSSSKKKLKKKNKKDKEKFSLKKDADKDIDEREEVAPKKTKDKLKKKWF